MSAEKSEREPPSGRYSRDGWQTTFLYNNTYSSALPLKFPLAAGENRITVTNVSSDGLGLGALTITEPDLGIPTYGEYRSVFLIFVMKCQTIIACFFHLKLILDLGARLRPAQRVQHLACGRRMSR